MCSKCVGDFVMLAWYVLWVEKVHFNACRDLLFPFIFILYGWNVNVKNLFLHVFLLKANFFAVLFFSSFSVCSLHKARRYHVLHSKTCEELEILNLRLQAIQCAFYSSMFTRADASTLQLNQLWFVTTFQLKVLHLWNALSSAFSSFLSSTIISVVI